MKKTISILLITSMYTFNAWGLLSMSPGAEAHFAESTRSEDAVRTRIMGRVRSTLSTAELISQHCHRYSSRELRSMAETVVGWPSHHSIRIHTNALALAKSNAERYPQSACAQLVAFWQATEQIKDLEATREAILKD